MTPVEETLYAARRRHDREINVAAFAPSPSLDQRICKDCGAARTIAEVIEKYCIRCTEIEAEIARCCREM